MQGLPRFPLVLLWASIAACGGDGNGNGAGGGGGGGGGGDCSASGGDPGFFEHSIDSTLEHGQGLEIVDMNGDGKDDVVMSYSLTDAVYIYLNGCENWERIEVAPPGSMIATGVAVGDYDGDDDLDIAVVEPFARESGDGSVRWYENPGALDGSWNEHDITGNTISGPLRIKAADLSGDGLLDLVVSTANYGPGTMWFRNTGGDFSGPNEIDAEITNVHSILVHDVDGDGALDVLSATYSDDEISWYESDRGPGAADTIGFTKHIIDAVVEPYGLALGNLDSDPELELVANHTRGVEVYDPGADPSTPWTASSISLDFAGDINVFIQIIDVDGDTQNDVAVASGTSSAATILLMDGQRSTTGSIAVVSDYVGFSAMEVGDIDGDGNIDLVTSTYEHGGSTDQLSWWQNRL